MKKPHEHHVTNGMERQAGAAAAANVIIYSGMHVQCAAAAVAA